MSSSWYDLNAEAYALSTWELGYFPGLSADIDEFSRLAKPGIPLLDVGCGGGRDVEALAVRGHRVIGVDLSHRLLKLTRARCASFQVGVANATALRLPFKDGLIGGVWSSGCLLHLKRAELPDAISEICRVLAQGAPVGISMKAGQGEEVREDGRVFTLVETEELRSLLHNFVISHVTGPVRKDWLYALAFKR